MSEPVYEQLELELMFEDPDTDEDVFDYEEDGRLHMMDYYDLSGSE